jgi:hypothetical protein
LIQIFVMDDALSIEDMLMIMNATRDMFSFRLSGPLGRKSGRFSTGGERRDTDH